MNKFFGFVGAAVIGVPILLAVIVASMMWRSWWLYPTWGWYIVPLGMPQISFWHFTALTVLLATITHQTTTRKDDRKIDWSAVLSLYTAPVLVWLILRWMRVG